MANKYESLRQPEATLDFHHDDTGSGVGVRHPDAPRDEILDGKTVKRRTEEFVARCAKAGMSRIRIITGKGIHSRGKPLVGPQVRRTLEHLRKQALIETWSEAREDEGGSGAIDVRLVAAGRDR